MSERSKVVLITGGSSGIGRASAHLFASQGWQVAIVARGQAALQATIDTCPEGASGRIAAFVADVSDSVALRSAAEAASLALGPIDVWVNNAGVGVFAAFVDMTEAEFRRVTEVNYFGSVNGTRIALEQMRPRDRGTIVTVGSAIGFRGTPLFSGYSGSKFALRGFVDSLHAELVMMRSRIWLSMVYPPSVNTPFYNHAIARTGKMGRPPPPVYQPEIVAEAVLFAATHRRRDVLVGGQSVATRFANRLAPGLLDRVAGHAAKLVLRSDKPELEAARDENVFTPSTGSGSTHGAFDEESLSGSLQFRVSRHRTGLALGGAALAALGVIGMVRR